MNSSNTTKSNFGKWGWSMIIYCAISFYLAAVLSTDTLNWFPTAFTQFRGWDPSVVDLCNTMAGIGGWLGIIGAIVFSVLAVKIGIKYMALFGNIISGIACFVFAITKNVTVFLIMIVVMVFISGNVQVNIVPNTLMNVWFPKKKGLALGWASMGLPLCTATIVLLFSAIGNPQTAYIIVGILCIVFGIISFFWIKNTPEEVGATPDNEPINAEEAKAHLLMQEEEAKKMTLGVIMKNRNTWLIGIGLGLLWMTTLGLVSNFVVRQIMVGIPQGTAIMMLTIAAVAGIIGSYIWGWLDQKFNTKRASLIYGVWYLVALLLMIFHNGSVWMNILATIFVGFGIGGIGNLIPSMIGTCFGRFGFLRANKVIAPLNTALRSSGLLIIGLIGVANLQLSYWVFFAGSVIAIILIAFIKIPEGADTSKRN